jgi:hypothetical protein
MIPYSSNFERGMAFDTLNRHFWMELFGEYSTFGRWSFRCMVERPLEHLPTFLVSSFWIRERFVVGTSLRESGLVLYLLDFHYTQNFVLSLVLPFESC